MIINQSLLFYLTPPLVIPFTDVILIKLFGKKARWFQLHAAINMLIVLHIKDDLYKLYFNPFNNIKPLEYAYDGYYIGILHLYHILFFKNSIMDIIHHGYFVMFGAVPMYYYYNLNLIRLATFVGCGLPGFIEYSMLTLVKNNLLDPIKQKIIIANIYNYFRYPLSIYAASVIYLACQLELTNKNKYITYYMILTIFINGAYFNKHTIENTIKHQTTNQ